jgi:hypothetical protein
MDKALDQLGKELGAKSFLNLPQGGKISLTHWQFPSKALIRDAIKVSLLILQLPPNAASHMDPMQVQAKASSKVPLSRIQLQLHPALFPIFVTHKDDKFWMTRDIPLAVMDLH